MRDHHFFVYIMASRSRVIYVGMTNDLPVRVFQHKTGRYKGFTQRYKVHRLVYFEPYRYVTSAIEREKELKGWRRKKRVALIESLNPTWEDLAADWFAAEELTRDPYAPVKMNLIRPRFGRSRLGRTRTLVSSAVAASRTNSRSLTPLVLHGVPTLLGRGSG